MNLSQKFSKILTDSNKHFDIEFIKSARKTGVCVFVHTEKPCPEGFIRQLSVYSNDDRGGPFSSRPFCWKTDFAIKVISLGFVPDKLI